MFFICLLRPVLYENDEEQIVHGNRIGTRMLFLVSDKIVFTCKSNSTLLAIKHFLNYMKI
jgi:hypothetical protein